MSPKPCRPHEVTATVVRQLWLDEGGQPGRAGQPWLRAAQRLGNGGANLAAAVSLNQQKQFLKGRQPA